MQPQYSIAIWENGGRLESKDMPDPFHTTTIRPRGLRAALAVLFGRYELQVMVNGSAETVERVLEINPDYKGVPGSERRALFDAEIAGALERLT